MTSAMEERISTAALLMAIEVGETTWHLGFWYGGRVRHRSINAWDQPRFAQELSRARKHFRLDESAAVHCCYEAGRIGFSLHRFLVSRGIESLVIDASSIEVDRRAKRQKTDRLDLVKMLGLMARYYVHGDRGVFRLVAVPSRMAESQMRLHRERERLIKERTGHRARIRSLLALHGIREKSLKGLDPRRLRDWEGCALSAALAGELRRELDRLALLDEQIQTLEKQQAQALKAPQTQGDAVAAKLWRVRSLGDQSSWILAKEFFGWRRFRNRKQVGALAGLTDCPYDSGASRRQQGISKAGNRRVRWVMIERAWSWLRYQPKSALSLWWWERFGHGNKRQRRIGIVALARKLLVALWKYVEFDELPQGAALKPA
jgi:transposase